MKPQTKYFASLPYVERQARFAKLGPAKIIHPRRYIERTLVRTLIEGAGKPSDVHQQDEFNRVVRNGMKQLNRWRLQIGATWNALALTRDRQALA